MKKTILMSTIFALMTFVIIGTTSCNKYKRNPADQIVGDYIGSGTDANGFPFVAQIVRISKVSKKRVKIEPVGHSGITAFEVDIEGLAEGVSSIDDGSGDLAASLENEVVSLAISTVQEETFGGQKQ